MTKTTTEGSDSSFYGLGIAPQLLEALKTMKFSTPKIKHRLVRSSLLLFNSLGYLGNLLVDTQVGLHGAWKGQIDGQTEGQIG